jgi:hypothetical protein
MTLIIQKPTGAKLNLAQTYVGIDDPDAAVYVAAVEAADGEALETATKVAIHSFVKGCKNDGIWPSIKASCILAGARTLTGALVPLVGTAPTNVGSLFVSGDYSRKTGLIGDGSTKRIDTNRNNNADPQDSKHVAAFVSTYPNAGGAIAGSSTWNSVGPSNLFYDFNSNRTLYRINGGGGFGISAGLPSPGFTGGNRSNSSNFITRKNQTDFVLSYASQTPFNGNIMIFAAGSTEFLAARLAFYSIGESLNLALLDTRVTDLINAFAAAIP